MDRNQGFQSSYNLKSSDMERPMQGSQSMGAISSMSSMGPTSGAIDNADLASDPASSSFFASDYKKHEDLREMLDSNKDNLKLEAMKRIIGMVAKGKDVSDLFPAVVKNVVSKNAEVKKLVYVYLVRYAEEQQDLALLSISTFQRALKDPNQLIRASALRVLSSIRVPMIVPIMMLAIKEAVMDMSPYVRKTAAHAIPKLYNLDPEQKEMLLEVIEKLLADKTTLVAGSAIQAFEEVCPDSFELIHKNYRKLCSLLVDVEEWGQCVIINMLTRYCRSQFVDPNKDDAIPESEQPFYGSDDSDDEAARPQKPNYMMDADHRLLLRTCKPLLNSRNASVVVAVAQLYHHCAPRSEIAVIPKALVRLLRSHKEVQFVVLSNIATISISRKVLFEPYLKSFYVRSCDPLPVKLLKLEILTNLATETSISTILRELQTYVTSSDKEFAAATIQAIGRCASSISEITDTCLSGLVSLMSNRDENVVAESVVVIKKLLQMQPSEHKAIITHMAKIVDNITVPMARASILWLIGEYSDRVPKIAPDVLRKAAKSFIQEEDIVKLQILNLAAKLCITNPKQTKLLGQYVFNLAKYDQNYDIRDRARFMRQLILPTEGGTSLSKYAKKIFLASKPAPNLASNYKDRDQFQLGTLSHLLNNKAAGYRDLPEWPDVAPDTSVRNVEPPAPRPEPTKAAKKAMKKKSFYSSSSSSDSTDESDSDESSSGSTGGADSPRSSESEEASGSEKLSSSDKKSDSSSEASEESSEEESSEESSEEERKGPTLAKLAKSVQKSPQKTQKQTASSGSKPSTDLLLLDLDDFAPNKDSGTPVMTPGSVLSPTMASELSSTSLNEKARSPVAQVVQAIFVPCRKYTLLNKVVGAGLSIDYRFTRSMSVFSPKMVSIELEFLNNCDTPVVPISLTGKKLPNGMALSAFPDINNLDEGSTTSVTMGIDFNDTTQPAQFEISTLKGKYNFTINCPVGELLQPISMSENDFNKEQGKLSGMNENKVTFDLPESSSVETLNRSIVEVANVLQVPSSDADALKYCAQTLANKTLVLVKAVLVDCKCKLVVNCEKMVIGSMLMKEIKSSIEKSTK